MTTIKLGKEELIKTIGSIIKEVHSTRADLNRREIESSMDDTADLDIDLPGEVNPYDEFESEIQAEPYDSSLYDIDDDYSDWRREREEELPGGIASGPEKDFDEDYVDFATSDRLERFGGHERFEESAPPGKKCEKIVKGLKKKFGKDSSAPYAIAWDKHNKGICEEESLQEKVLRQVVRNFVKENYYNLMGVNTAEPTKSNGNGVDSVVMKRKNETVKEETDDLSIGSDFDYASYKKKVRELFRIYHNKTLPKDVRLAAKKEWNDLNKTFPVKPIKSEPVKQVADDWGGAQFTDMFGRQRGTRD